jgi:hypothetical protein
MERDLRKELWAAWTPPTTESVAGHALKRPAVRFDMALRQAFQTKGTLHG